MKNKFIHTLISCTCVPFFLFTSCSGKGALSQSGAVHVPSEWHQLPEDQPESNRETPITPGPAPVTNAGPSLKEKEKLAQSLHRVFVANQETIEKVPETHSRKSYLNETLPRDWTPWHLEYFTTDLAVSTSGLIGVLSVKGTPSVQAYWRKKRPANPPRDTSPVLHPEPTSGTHEGISREELAAQVEPSVRAAVASGKVQDGPILRESIQKTAAQFQELVLALENQPGSEWWVSGLRVEFNIGASGKVVGIGTVGGDLQLRYEWKRMMRVASDHKPLNRNHKWSPIASHLAQFVSGMQADLAKAAESGLSAKGYQGYTFRIGIGVSAKGDIGIAKGNGSVVGYVNFNRDVPRPSTTLPPGATLHEPVLIIENEPSPAHIAYAESHAIAMEKDEENEGNSHQVIYKIDHERFRNGLTKAMGIAEWFAERGSETPSTGGWNIYQIKTGVDFSISGDVGLVSVGGIVSGEIAFYNQGF